MPQEDENLLIWETPIKAAYVDDKAVGHIYDTDESGPLVTDPQLKQSFGQWESVAATLCNKVDELSKYDPSTTDYTDSSFSGVRHLFSTSPYWDGQLAASSATVHVTPGDLTGVVDLIRSYWVDADLVGSGANALVDNVKQIAYLATNSGGVEVKRSLLQESAIAVSSGKVHLVLIHAYVTFELDPQAMIYSLIDQSIQINLARSVLNFDFCARHANSILGYSHKTVDGWLRLAAGNKEPKCAGVGWPP